MTQKKVFVPEEHFTEVPESFSGVSQIVDITSDNYRTGIILANMEELENALRVYNGDVVPESKATADEQFRAMAQDHGPLGAGLFTLVSDKIRGERDFVGNILSEAKSALQERGKYYREFDYDGMGSNFFKTCVEVERTGSIYVLNIIASSVGRKPEEKLAEQLGKPRALIHSDANIKMSIVDDWWFNIDLETLLKNVPISKKDVRKLADSIGEGRWEDKPELTFKYDGEKFQLGVEVDSSSYVRIRMPNEQTESKRFLVSRGSNVIGPAWDTYRNTEEAEPVLPVVTLNLRYPGERYTTVPVVDSGRMEHLKQARDSLAQRVQPEN